jgi:diguanylate cyclase (GGDEF)-like protein/PAS domain S-box-containing protein
MGGRSSYDESRLGGSWRQRFVLAVAVAHLPLLLVVSRVHGVPASGVAAGAAATAIGTVVVLAVWQLGRREREATERRLRESEARFRVPFEGASVGMAVVRPDGRYLEVNDALCRMVGYTDEELLARRFQDITIDDDLDDDMELVRRCLAGEIGSYGLRKRYRRKDGGVVWVDLTVALIRDDLGRPRYFVSQAVDVTDRHLAEEALAASEKLFAALVEYGSDLVAIVDEEGRMRYASPAYRRVLGADPAERIGTPMIEFVHPDDRERLMLEAWALVDDVEVTVRSEFRAAHADGSWRWVESTMVNRLHDPAVRGVVVNSRDITDRVESAELLAHQATHDPLTGVANRSLLEERLVGALSGARRRGEVLATLFVDLDRFKRVNDDLGHAAGDLLLCTVADRVRACLRPEDTVARIGGDEFVVVAAVADAAAAGALADRLCAAVVDPVVIGGEAVAVGCSIGVVLDGDVDADVPGELVRAADLAMYRAKAAGRGSWARYAPGAVVEPPPEPPGERVETQWRDLLETTAEAIVVHVEGTIVAVSRRAVELLEATTEAAVVGRTVFELVTPESRAVSHDRRAVMESGGWPGAQLVRIATFSGAIIEAEVMSHPVVWQGRVAVEIVVRPVTSGWDTLARIALDTIGPQAEAVIVTDLDLNVVAWNGHAAACYGWPAEEVLGRNLAEVIGWGASAEQLAEANAAIADAGEWQGTVRHQARDGSDVVTDATVRLVRGSSGRAIGLVAVQVPVAARAGADADADLVGELAAAVDTELVVHYQPILRASDGEVVKVEALVRWQHPEHGLLPPGRFIPFAEGTPLIGRITERVLHVACEQVVAWRATSLPDLELAVNVSANELAEEALVDRVTAALSSSGLPADAVWLEVTETSIADDPEGALAGLRRLQQLGCRVALDDFGTGFATLAQLHRYPVHAVKIDRLFVDGLTTNPGDAAIVRSVIALACDLGLSVVAEGVEDEDQLHALRLLGCDLVQGFLLGRPVAAEVDPPWLTVPIAVARFVSP